MVILVNKKQRPEPTVVTSLAKAKPALHPFKVDIHRALAEYKAKLKAIFGYATNARAPSTASTPVESQSPINAHLQERFCTHSKGLPKKKKKKKRRHYSRNQSRHDHEDCRLCSGLSG